MANDIGVFGRNLKNINGLYLSLEGTGVTVSNATEKWKYLNEQTDRSKSKTEAWYVFR